MDLLNLKIKSIKSQLSYLKVDLEYKQKIVEEGDKDFLSMMNEILDENPDLKKSYFEKEEKRKEKIIEDILNKAQEDEKKYQEEVEKNLNEDTDDNSNEDNDKIELNSEDKPKQKDSKIKKLYRKIVKLTHPDKIGDIQLNSLYLNATMYYDTNNLYGIYMICDELNIKYDIEESEVIIMDTKVKELKKEIDFIEGTYTWKWSTASSDDIRRQIILEFINMKIKIQK